MMLRSHSLKFIIKKFSSVLSVIGVSLSLASCGSGGGGSGVEQNVNTAQPNTNQAGFVYQGPPPQTEDTQRFRLNLFDNLNDPNDRCGECHGVEQPPLWLDRNDVNNAYNITITENLVNLETPALSRIVTILEDDGGHFCWLESDAACANIITNFVESWANEAGSVSNVIVLTEPADPDREPGATRSFPADTALFEQFLYDDILTNFCAECHSENGETAQQQPFFASDNVQVAYENSLARIDLETPANSRFVIRMIEGHNCWTDSCDQSASIMQSAISAMAGEIPITEIDQALVTSSALNLGDGILASSGGRIETNAVAIYEFGTGEGTVAFDTSGVDPAANLNFFDDVEWVRSGGIRINDGQARATTASSRKFYDTIARGTGEYSIEAWVVPGNITQEGPARIVTYSGGDETRNFTLGQTIYNYNFLSRSSLTDPNAMPFVSTPDADEVLQATLQHVVTTYDPIEGRAIYVNGELVSEADPVPGGTLNDWDDSFAFVVGNETSGNFLWQGTVRLLAIYNRAMSPEDIQNNFEVGVGEEFFLLFNISDIIDVADAYIVFGVSQFDDFGYLFNAPFFFVLGGDASGVSGIPIEGLRIGINGSEALQGQAYSRISTTLEGSEFGDLGQPLSSVGTIIAIENGPESDEFFLTFDRLGPESFVRLDNTTIVDVIPEDIEQSQIGIKTFEEIDATLSAITTVPRTNDNVANTFNTVQQALPSSPAIEGFLASHQMGITQLAVEYCNELTLDNELRAAYFPGFNFGVNETQAFGDVGLVIDPILEGLLVHDIPGADSTENPDLAEVEGELSALIDIMVNECATSTCGTPSRTREIVTATCSAATASAIMLIQ